MTDLTPRQMLDAIQRALEKSARRAERQELVRVLLEAEEKGLDDRTVRDLVAEARASVSASRGNSGS